MSANRPIHNLACHLSRHPTPPYLHLPREGLCLLLTPRNCLLGQVSRALCECVHLCTMPLDPIVPCFDGVRLAAGEDLPRIATVAAAGFFHSPTFQYQRTRHAEFPDDTLQSYWEEYRESMLDPQCVVLVAEDLVVSDENARVYDALRRAAGYVPCAGPKRERVVVGVASVCKWAHLNQRRLRAGRAPLPQSALQDQTQGARRRLELTLYGRPDQPAAGFAL